MNVQFIRAENDAPIERIYIAAITLKNFRGARNTRAHLFRSGYSANELDALAGKGVVGPADPATPPELIPADGERAALECVLEAFTLAEGEALAAYLKERYADQISDVFICPMDLPAPLGVGPLAKLPETGRSGFIHFDRAKNYPLPFAFKGYYELDAAPDA